MPRFCTAENIELIHHSDLDVLNGNNSTMDVLNGNNSTMGVLSEVNRRMRMKLWPVYIYLAMLMLTGACGNGLVCYIFGYKKKKGTQNFFIVCLGVFDIVTCIFAIPYEIFDLSFYVSYEFESIWVCKFFKFLFTSCAIGSCLTIFFITHNRYLKVCRPSLYPPPFYRFHARVFVPLLILIPLVFSLPVLFIYGYRTKEVSKVPGVMTSDCSKADDIPSLVYDIYMIFLFVCFVFMTVSFVIAYSLVLKEIHQRRSLRHESQSHVTSSNSGQDTEEGKIEITDSSLNDDDSPHDSGLKETSVSFLLTKAFVPVYEGNASGQGFNLSLELTSPCEQNASNLVPGHGKIAKSKKGMTSSRDLIRRGRSWKKRAHTKTSVIAFLVSLMFILSLLPYLSLMIAKSFTAFDTDLEGAPFILYNIFLRSWLVNSVANPVIYGFCDTKFRDEVKQLLCRSRHCY